MRIMHTMSLKKISNIIINITIKNNKSAIVSNLAPKLLSVFVFLAIYPSNISVNPQIEYKIKNSELYFLMNSKLIAKPILIKVITFAILKSPITYYLLLTLYHTFILKHTSTQFIDFTHKSLYNNYTIVICILNCI